MCLKRLNIMLFEGLKQLFVLIYFQSKEDNDSKPSTTVKASTSKDGMVTIFKIYECKYMF